LYRDKLTAEEDNDIEEEITYTSNDNEDVRFFGLKKLFIPFFYSNTFLYMYSWWLIMKKLET
jgi:hypothetical protein